MWKCESVSHSVMSDLLQSHWLELTRLLCLWDSPGKNAGVGSHSLLQAIFLMQGLNRGLLHCRQILYHLSYQGSPLHSWTCIKFCSSWVFFFFSNFEFFNMALKYYFSQLLGFWVLPSFHTRFWGLSHPSPPALCKFLLPGLLSPLPLFPDSQEHWQFLHFIL